MGGVDAGAAWGGDEAGSASAVSAGGGDVGGAGTQAALGGTSSAPSGGSVGSAGWYASEIASREATARGTTIDSPGTANLGGEPGSGVGTATYTDPRTGMTFATEAIAASLGYGSLLSVGGRTDAYARAVAALPTRSEQELYMARNDDPYGARSPDIGVRLAGQPSAPSMAAAYLNRPDVYPVTDAKQLALMGTGLTSYQAAERLQFAATSKRESDYYLNLLTQAEVTSHGEAAAKHTWAKDTGLPQAPNEYEYVSDLFLYAGRGYPTQENERFTPTDYSVLGLPGGKGFRDSMWGGEKRDFRGVMDVIAKAERSGEMGVYGTTKSYSSGYGNLPLSMQQSIGAQAAESRGEKVSYTQWGLSPEQMGVGKYVSSISEATPTDILFSGKQPAGTTWDRYTGGFVNAPPAALPLGTFGGATIVSLEKMGKPSPLSDSSLGGYTPAKPTETDITRLAVTSFFGFQSPEKRAETSKLMTGSLLSMGNMGSVIGGFMKPSEEKPSAPSSISRQNVTSWSGSNLTISNLRADIEARKPQIFAMESEIDSLVVGNVSGKNWTGTEAGYNLFTKKVGEYETARGKYATDVEKYNLMDKENPRIATTEYWTGGEPRTKDSFEQFSDRAFNWLSGKPDVTKSDAFFGEGDFFGSSARSIRSSIPTNPVFDVLAEGMVRAEQVSPIIWKGAGGIPEASANIAAGNVLDYYADKSLSGAIAHTQAHETGFLSPERTIVGNRQTNELYQSVRGGYGWSPVGTPTKGGGVSVVDFHSHPELIPGQNQFLNYQPVASAPDIASRTPGSTMSGVITKSGILTYGSIPENVNKETVATYKASSPQGFLGIGVQKQSDFFKSMGVAAAITPTYKSTVNADALPSPFKSTYEAKVPGVTNSTSSRYIPAVVGMTIPATIPAYGYATAEAGFGLGTTELGLSASLASNPVGWGIILGLGSVSLLEKSGRLGLTGETKEYSVRTAGQQFAQWQQRESYKTPTGKFGSSTGLPVMPVNGIMGKSDDFSKPSLKLNEYGNVPSDSPYKNPWDNPDEKPMRFPTNLPSDNPIKNPYEDQGFPTRSPIKYPRGDPYDTPSNYPTGFPTGFPTELPNKNSKQNPTKLPVGFPIEFPTEYPNKDSTKNPFKNPYDFPLDNPNEYPKKEITRNPFAVPFGNPFKPGQGYDYEIKNQRPEQLPRREWKIDLPLLPNFNFGSPSSGSGAGGYGKGSSSHREYIPISSSLDRLLITQKQPRYVKNVFASTPKPRKSKKSLLW